MLALVVVAEDACPAGEAATEEEAAEILIAELAAGEEVGVLERVFSVGPALLLGGVLSIGAWLVIGSVVGGMPEAVGAVVVVLVAGAELTCPAEAPPPPQPIRKPSDKTTGIACSLTLKIEDTLFL